MVRDRYEKARAEHAQRLAVIATRNERESGVGTRVRPGMTMIELMVAMGIIGIGVLAMASGATLVTRLSGGAAIQSRASVVAASHLEQLRALGCASVTSGTDTIRAVISSWTTQPVTISSKQRGISVLLTVQYPTVKGMRSQSYKTIVPC